MMFTNSMENKQQHNTQTAHQTILACQHLTKFVVALYKQHINIYTLCHWKQCVHKKTAAPKYNGVIFEILGKHHWNFYNRI